MKILIFITLMFLSLLANSQALRVNILTVQQQQQLSRKGGDAAKAAYKVGGLEAVAKMSSDCMADVRAGKQAPDYCIGVEIVGMKFLKLLPEMDEPDQAHQWLDADKMTPRVMGLCYMFLKLRTDQDCAYRVAMGVVANEPYSLPGQLKKIGPVFNCKLAASRVEKMICASDELSALDLKLSEVFNLAKDEHPRSHNGDTGESSFPLGEDQARWRIKVRDACITAACIKDAYAKRELEIKEKFPF